MNFICLDTEYKILLRNVWKKKHSTAWNNIFFYHAIIYFLYTLCPFRKNIALESHWLQAWSFLTFLYRTLDAFQFLLGVRIIAFPPERVIKFKLQSVLLFRVQYKIMHILTHIKQIKCYSPQYIAHTFWIKYKAMYTLNIIVLNF